MRPRIALPALLCLALVTAGCAGTPTDGATTTPTDGATATPTDGATTTTPTGGAGTTTTPTDRPTTPTTATSTAPPPTGSVDFAGGPKAPPERPSTLDASAVGEYVRTYEYRYAYNSLWINEYTDVVLDCRVDDVTRRAWGYETVVTCTGHSNTDVPENATATPGPHADWFTQTYRYRVSEGATERNRTEIRDPVQDRRGPSGASASS